MIILGQLRALRQILRRRLGERGSILILAGLMAVILIGSAGLAVDLGMMYSAKARLSAAVDAASLAAVPDISNSTTYNAKITNYMSVNDSAAVVDAITADTTNSNILIKAHEPVRLYFLSLFGFNTVNVQASAKAGTGGNQPLDAALVIDNTASMAGTPTTDTKNAATSFVQTLLGTTTGSGNTLLGITPFRGCYNTPNTSASCVNVSTQVSGLTANPASIDSIINAYNATGGSGTNVCTGLWQGYNVLFNANGIGGTAHHATANTLRFMILLSDGGANYNGSVSYHTTGGNQDSPPGWTAVQAPGSSASPAAAGSCRVSGAGNQQSGDTNTGCGNTESQFGRDLDLDAYKMSQTLKDTNNKVEIYTVTFSVCQWDTSGANQYCVPGEIGGSTGYNHNITDQNILKCIASSTSGTNDHAYSVSSSGQLTTVFNEIAGRIINRLIQ